jgi:Domain of unknown function (DUF4865)
MVLRKLPAEANGRHPMLAKQYSHRLPADYDMGLIRERAARRGPMWDRTKGLAFKGFVARERGQYGATGNAYSSVYLWLDASAAADFIMDERFQSVTDSFGRPRIETWLPLDARKGPATQARALYREDLDLGEAVDRAALRVAETERNGALAAQADTLAVVTALDPWAWRLVRFTLSSGLPDPSRPGTAYQVFYLARPGIASLR